MKTNICLAAVLAAISAPGMSWAESGESIDLAPLTVTAAKRVEQIENTPLSLAAFGAESLELSRAEGIEKFAELTPNLKFYSVGSRRTALLYMRGVGSSGPNMPAVGLFVDDVYYPKTGLSDRALLGTRRVEVLRGPQSTLYGRNTEGGAINIVSAGPSPETDGKLALSAGDYALFRGELDLSGPAGEDGDLFYSLNAAAMRRDGYTRNDYLDEDVDHVDRFSGRIRMDWMPSDLFELALSVYGDRDRDGGYQLSTLDQVVAKPYHVRHNISGEHKRDTRVYDLQARYHGGDFDLVSISAFRDWQNRDRYDQDFSPADIYSLYDTDELESFSQELRMVSRAGGDLDWLAGLYFYRNRERDDDYTDYGADAGVYGAIPGLRETALLGVDTWGIAPFGRASLNLSPRLRASGGLRFEHQEKDAAGRSFYSFGAYRTGPETPFEAGQDYDEWMPAAGISFDLAETVMSYVRIARGFREGGFNNGEQGADATYAPERAWSYEAGLKSDWADRRLIVNLSAFRMEIEDQQLIQFKPGGFGFSVKNVGESRNTGAELEISAAPLDWVELRGGVGYVSTEFISYSDPALGADYSGNSTPFVPDYNYFATAIFERDTVADLVARVRMGITGIGSTSWNEANTVRSGSYNLFNASLGLQFKRYELSVFGRNLGDKVYPAAVYAFPNSTPIAQPGAPRTIGVMISAEM